MEDSYTGLARKAIKEHLEKGTSSPTPFSPTPEMTIARAGVFVSLHKKDGALRGCIGTFLPTRRNLALEIAYNAVAAAASDHRFPPVTLQELPLLEIKVDILSEPRQVEKDFKIGNKLPEILNPKRYGLIVSTGDGRRGLLLPDIPGVKSAKEQLEICCSKGGISLDEAVSLDIFTVTRHSE